MELHSKIYLLACQALAGTDSRSYSAHVMEGWLALIVVLGFRAGEAGKGYVLHARLQWRRLPEVTCMHACMPGEGWGGLMHVRVGGLCCSWSEGGVGFNSCWFACQVRAGEGSRSYSNACRLASLFLVWGWVVGRDRVQKLLVSMSGSGAGDS